MLVTECKHLIPALVKMPTQKLRIEEQVSELQDLDFAEAVSRLNLQSVALQAAQQAYVKIQGLSLFNYLR